MSKRTETCEEIRGQIYSDAKKVNIAHLANTIGRFSEGYSPGDRFEMLESNAQCAARFGRYVHVGIVRVSPGECVPSFRDTRKVSVLIKYEKLCINNTLESLYRQRRLECSLLTDYLNEWGDLQVSKKST